jgi:hypothetical protein
MKAGTRYGIALIIALALTGGAAAETAEDSNDRFTMSPADGGFLRLDKKTGAVAMCARTGNTWACAPVQDQTSLATPGELSRLRQENKDLKDRVEALEEALETTKPPPPESKLDLPTDQQVDQALDYLERVYKKIRDRVKDLDKPLPPAENGPPRDDQAPPPKGSL